ncbi:MAG: nuclear transport factor 2 family protein [Flavobacteriaceae bacterium]
MNIKLLILLFINFNLFSQDKLSMDNKSIDLTIKTLYSVISGDKEVERDWDLFKSLFHPDAKLIPSGPSKDGDFQAVYLSPDDYINRSGKWLFENGFHEREIHRVTDIFGNIAHVFSTYEAFRESSDETPFMRGINSIQLMKSEEKWVIINIYWMQESNFYKIPKKYLYN